MDLTPVDLEEELQSPTTKKNYFVLTYVVGSSPDILSLIVHYPTLVLSMPKIPLSIDIVEKIVSFTIQTGLCEAMDSVLDF